MQHRFKILCSLLSFVLCIGMLAADAMPVKYVFLFIGDGMSYPQIEAGERLSQEIGRGRLSMNTFPHSASTATRCANAEITDSAAAGTALACGRKTNKGFLGLAPDGERLESIAEFAKKNGRRVGIATSVTMNHATPAAFFGHRASRNQKYELGVDMLRSGFDFFAGGALEQPLPAADRKIAENDRLGNLDERMRKDGFSVVSDRAALASLKEEDLPAVVVATNQGEMPFALDAREDGISLPDITRKAIELLDNPNGFFLMVEGGRIDQAAHGNDFGSMAREVIDFDECIRIACDFMKRHPDDTLIVVTGDHETGGLVLNDVSKIGRAVGQKVSASEFSRIFEALKRDAPSAGIDEMARLIETHYGLFLAGSKGAKAASTLSRDETNRLELAFYRSIGNKEAEKGFFDNAEKAKAAYKDDKPGFVYLVGLLFGERCGASWLTRGHSALPVKTMAAGACAESIVEPNPSIAAQKPTEDLARRGISIPKASIDNTDVAERLRPLLGPIRTKNRR